ncbi:metallophosphoesterase [Gracilibacillus boraciitolerans]|nr:metallophosphoesterase [Gracilibacillus boraciitolerans]
MKRGIKYMIWIGFIILLLSLLLKIYHDTNYFKVKTLMITSDQIQENQSISILHLTDLHNKQFDEQNQRLLNKIKSLQTDIIVITGDVIDRDTEQMDDVLSFIEKVAAFNPDTYYVTGNHEWGNPLREKFFEGILKSGVHYLDNKNAAIEINNVLFQLAGIGGDSSTGHSDMEAALRGLDDRYFTILLAHAPEVIVNHYPQKVDLTLSGHTHGGQIRLPFIGAVIAPGQGLFPEYDQGLFQINEQQQLYIDSGLGTSTLDIRLFNQSQMTLITVKGENG